jgi:hypothetical protein
MRNVLLSIVSGVAVLVASRGFAQEIAGNAAGEVDRVISGPYHPRRGGFDLEVLVGGWPLRQESPGGERRVEVVTGSEYELRLTNPLPGRVAVALSVDGLNVIDGRRTSPWEASKWVVHPRGTLTVTGWQVGLERARRFYFTTERDSYATRIGRPGEFGVIAAAYYRERWPVRELVRPRTAAPLREEADSAPAGALDANAALGTVRDRGREDWKDRRSHRPPRERAATGIGASVGSSIQVVEMDLDPEPVAVVTIRYDFRRPGHRVEPRTGLSLEPGPIRERGWAPARDDDRFAPEP